jgi:hypothetical protein
MESFQIKWWLLELDFHLTLDAWDEEVLATFLFIEKYCDVKNLPNFSPNK